MRYWPEDDYIRTASRNIPFIRKTPKPSARNAIIMAYSNTEASEISPYKTR